jgi:lysozyme
MPEAAVGFKPRARGMPPKEAICLMNDFDYSSRGLALTRSFEGLRLAAYQDSAGVWTIGYGHTGAGVHAAQRITESEAETLLRVDLAAALESVRRAVLVTLTQGQFDALVDFCFNVGRGNFLGSSLLRCVNTGETERAAEQFGLWVHAGGRVVPGLARRRAAEAALFAGRGLDAPMSAEGTPQNPHRSTEVAVAVPGSALALPGNGR